MGAEAEGAPIRCKRRVRIRVNTSAEVESRCKGGKETSNLRQEVVTSREEEVATRVSTSRLSSKEGTGVWEEMMTDIRVANSFFTELGAAVAEEEQQIMQFMPELVTWRMTSRLYD